MQLSLLKQSAGIVLIIRVLRGGACWKCRQVDTFMCLIIRMMAAEGLLECGGEVGDEVIDVLDADAEAEHVRVYACCYLLLRAELGVGC